MAYNDYKVEERTKQIVTQHKAKIYMEAFRFIKKKRHK